MIGAGNGERDSALSRCARLATDFARTPLSADGQFKKLSSLLKRDEWATSESFSTNSSRVANRTTLVPLIEDALREHPTSHWLERFKGGGFPFAPVNDIRGTFDHPQTRAREMVREVEHPRAGKIKLVAPAVQYNGHRMEVRLRAWLALLLPSTDTPTTLEQFTRPPPVLRQHSVEVLRELGYADARIAELQHKRVI